jgi:hypothetical protein
MNKQQQLNSDKKVLASLEAEYKRARRVTDSVRAHVTDINFEDMVPDPQERYLMMDELHVYEQVQQNLLNRIRFYRNRVKGAEQSSQVCCDDIATQQDRQNEAALKLCNLLVKGRMSVYAPSKKCAKCGGNLLCGIGVKEGKEIICFNCANQITNEELQQALDEYRAACTHHCGQDARCQVDDVNAVVNESQVPNSLKELVGMQVVSVMPHGWKCQGCAYDSDYFRCEKKVELVGGYMLCLANIPIVTE